MVEDLLRAAAETEQAHFSLVSIDVNTIVFTLINTLIIVLLYFFFLHKPVCKILDKRAETVNKDMDEAEKAKIALSSTQSYDISLPFITMDATGPKHIQMTLTSGRISACSTPRRCPNQVEMRSTSCCCMFMTETLRGGRCCS